MTKTPPFARVIERMRPSEMAAALARIADKHPAAFTDAVSALPESDRLLGALRNPQE